MGFDSIDNFVSEVTNQSKFFRADFVKGTTGLGTVVAGRWYDLTYFPGYPASWVHGNYCTNYDFQGGYTGWTIGSANWAYTPATHLMTRTANADVSTLSQNTTCESGVTYRVQITITRSAGTITPSLGGQAGTGRSSSGTFIENIVCGATANAPLVFTPDSSFAGTVDLVIVQRVKSWTPYNKWVNPGSDILLYCGGDTGAESKHIVNFGAWGNATTTAPSVLCMVDMLGCYPVIATDSAASQALDQGTNYVANGVFTGNADGWTLGAAWHYNSNAVDKDSAGVTTLSQTPAITPYNKMSYVITFTISNYSVGGVMTVGYGGGTTTVTITGDGTYKAYIDATGAGDLIFTPTDAMRLTIDTVTCYSGIPRYKDGLGVRAFYSLQAANGANAHNFIMSYTNPTGTSGQSLGATVAGTASAIVGHISHSGVAAGNYGPYLPLGQGDRGILSVESCQFSAAGATANGCVNLVLVRPLVSIPITTGFVAAERDLMNQLPSLPQIKDGACIGFIVFAGAVIAAGNQYQGYFDVAWS